MTLSPALHAMKDETKNEKSFVQCMASKDTNLIKPMLDNININKKFELKIQQEHKLAGEVLRCRLIHYAVLNNWPEIISTLVELGANLNEAIYVPSLHIYLTPLGLAILCDYRDVIRALGDNKADITNVGYFKYFVVVGATNGYDEQEPLNTLHFACELGNVDLVKMFLEEGKLNVNAVSKSRFRDSMFSDLSTITALDIAHQKKNNELIQLLYKLGASNISIEKEIKNSSLCSLF